MDEVNAVPSTLYQYNYLEIENTAIESVFDELFQQLEIELESH